MKPSVSAIFTPSQTIQHLSISEDIAISAYHNIFHLKPHETVLIVTEPDKLAEATLWHEAAKSIVRSAHAVVIQDLQTNGQEPPLIASLMMLKSQVIVMNTTHSLTHTKARQAASKTGARIASLPGATLNMLTRTLDLDYDLLKTRATSTAGLLTNTSSATLTCPKGTNLTLNLTNRIGIADDGDLSLPKAYGNLPAGEAFIAPLEGTSQGKLVISGAMAGVTTGSDPITLIIQDGRVTNILGEQRAQELKASIKSIDNPLAYNIAELGIGLHPQANPYGPILEAEKSLGTTHIALGNNLHFGGTVDVPYHADGVILSPTLRLDDQLVIRDGNLIL